VKERFIKNQRLRRTRPMSISGALIAALLLGTSCNPKELPRADYVPVSQLEQTYGRLISVANAPTPDQNGTGDLLGLFRDDTETVWGIPLWASGDGTLLGCAPPTLRHAPVSDMLPPDTVEIIGAANEPNGWRGGTGNLGLMLRDAHGRLRWHHVSSIEITTGPVCRSHSAPVQILKHYRLVKAPSP